MNYVEDTGAQALNTALSATMLASGLPKNMYTTGKALLKGHGSLVAPILKKTGLMFGTGGLGGVVGEKAGNALEK